LKYWVYFIFVAHAWESRLLVAFYA
jgi:hypothetical protein